MRTVLHLLPHPGGGAETYIDVLEGLDGYRHERVPFSTTRSRRRGVASLIARWPGIARRARAADIVHAHGDSAAILAAPLLRGDRRRSHPRACTDCGGSAARARWLVRRSLRTAVGAASRTACSARAERDDLARDPPSAASTGGW